MAQELRTAVNTISKTAPQVAPLFLASHRAALRSYFKMRRDKMIC